MALSEQERRALQEIERSLLADDPKFGASVRAHSEGGNGGALTLRGIAVVVIGLVLLVAGVALSQQSLAFVAISIVGFLVMLGGGIWMLRGGGEVKAKPAKKKPTVTKPQANGGFSARMEDNFRKRFEN